MLIFKVVWRDPQTGGFYSVCAEGKLSVHYELGKEAHTPRIAKERGYYLTAFENIADAIRYGELVVGGEILLCRGDRFLGFTAGKSLNTCRDSRRFTQKIAINEDDLLFKKGVFEGWPSGTLFFETLTPLSVITNWRGQ